MKKIVFFLLLIFSSQAGCTLTDPEVMEMLQALQAQNDKLLEEINQMKGQLTALDGKYQAILAGLVDNKKDLEALKAQVDALKTQIADQLKKIDQLNAQLTQQGADIVKLSAELAAVKASLADLLVKFEQYIKEQNSPLIYEQNGTIKCPEAKVGDKKFVNGKQYEVVDRALLIKRRDEGADLTCLCTSLVTDMNKLFHGATLNQAIGNWDVSKVKTMFQMFASSNFNSSLAFWDVSSVEDMGEMFGNSNFNQPIGNWNVKNVKNMSWMFHNASFNQPIGTWDVSGVLDMNHMFRENKVFNQPLENWNVGNVKNMAIMFGGANRFNQPIEKWNMGNVESIGGMFINALAFNQPLGKWNVSKVNDMTSLFLNASTFNQNISSWCVSTITSEPANFSAQSPLTAQNKPKWGTCPPPSDSSGNLVDKYAAGSVFGAVGPTIIVDVTNPKTGKTWMDRNLGASRAATSSTDAASYGDLYQWGRGADGHQLRTSTTTTSLSSSNQPGNSNFILAPNGPSDWRNAQNDNLWQGVNGVNNPCPSGYRLPTEAELQEERASWNTNTSVGAFASPLKLPMAGSRDHSNGGLVTGGTSDHGFYWSSTIDATSSRNLYFLSNDTYMLRTQRAVGQSIRCIKN